MVKLLPTKTSRTSRSLESNWEACRERCRMTVFCSSALKGGHVWWGPERSYCMGPLEIGWGYGAPKTKEGSYEPLCTKKLVGAHLVPKDWNWVGRSFAKQNRPNNFEEFREFGRNRGNSQGMKEQQQGIPQRFHPVPPVFWFCMGLDGREHAKQVFFDICLFSSNNPTSYKGFFEP